MAFDLGWDIPPAVPHPDIEIRRVRDDAGLNDLIAVSSEAFGRDPSKMGALFRARLRDPTLGLFVAYADDEPAAAGRLEMPSGRSFAGLWGSGTRPAFRGRGIYRAMVAARAREAKRLGFRYLYIEARDTSRPILERLGFMPVTTITAWILRPS